MSYDKLSLPLKYRTMPIDKLCKKIKRCQKRGLKSLAILLMEYYEQRTKIL